MVDAFEVQFREALAEVDEAARAVQTANNQAAEVAQRLVRGGILGGVAAARMGHPVVGLFVAGVAAAATAAAAALKRPEQERLLEALVETRLGLVRSKLPLLQGIIPTLESLYARRARAALGHGAVSWDTTGPLEPLSLEAYAVAFRSLVETRRVISRVRELVSTLQGWARDPRHLETAETDHDRGVASVPAASAAAMEWPSEAIDLTLVSSPNHMHIQDVYLLEARGWRPYEVEYHGRVIRWRILTAALWAVALPVGSGASATRRSLRHLRHVLPRSVEEIRRQAVNTLMIIAFLGGTIGLLVGALFL